MNELHPRDGIVLRRIEHGDRNRILTIFTKEHGKLAVYVRGARGVSKRFGGPLDLFQQGIATFGHRRKANAMPILQAFDARNTHASIRADVTKFAIASFWSELVLSTTAERDSSSMQFDQICRGLAALNDAPHGMRRDLILGFQLQWFLAMGVMPPLEDDALIKANLPSLSDRGLAIARALSSGATIAELDAHHADEVGVLTRAIRHSVVQRPLTSARFLHQVLSGLDG